MLRPTKGICTTLLAAMTGLLAAALPQLLGAAAQATDNELVLGIFPRRPAAETRQMFQPLADHLSKSLGQPVRLAVSPDFPAFWRNLQNGSFHLVHSNQFHYVRANHELGHRVIAMNEENGQNRIRSTLWVRRDSGIETAEDLRGQKIIFGGGKMAMVSYVMATDLLRQAGLKESDYLKQFAINPTHAMQALFYRQGVAAGLNRAADQQVMLKRKVDFSQLRPLLVSGAVAHHPWSVSPALPEKLATRIREALLSLKGSRKGRDVLASASLTGISPASDKDYDPIRNIIRRVSGQDYGGR